MAATHYELLGVPPTATPEEIRAAYRALARRHHPDTQLDVDPVTADRSRLTMASLNAAWSVLGDPVRRRAYDAELARPGEPSGPAARPAGGPGPRAAADEWHPFSDGELDEEDLDEEPYGNPPPRRPADSMVMTPVLLLAFAVALFFFSTMVQSPGIRTASILLIPVAGVGFVAAPLIVMIRARSRDD